MSVFVGGKTIEVYSTKPLWYRNESGNIKKITNSYSNAEMVTVYNANLTHYNIFITGESVLLPYCGITLFKNENDVNRYGNDLNPNIMNTIVKDSFASKYKSKFVKSIPAINGINFESGLYSHPDIDNEYLDPESSLYDVHYLDKSRKIQKIKKPNKTLQKYIEIYLKTVDVSVNCNVNMERLIFEVYVVDGGKLYISHCTFGLVREESIPLTWSPIQSFPLFTSREAIELYKPTFTDMANMTSDAYLMYVSKYRLISSLSKTNKDRETLGKVKLVTDTVIGLALQWGNLPIVKELIGKAVSKVGVDVAISKLGYMITNK